MTKPTDHNSYIAAAPEAFRPLLNHVRETILKNVSGAEEIFAYNMPGFRIGSATVGFAAFSKQCGLYVSADAISACSEAIAAEGLEATKNGVKFSPTKPISDDLLLRLAEAARVD